MTAFVLRIFLLTALNICSVNCDDLDETPETLDGEAVLKMGRSYKNPLLRLIGTAMKNDKKDILSRLCSLYRCDEWTDWTNCTADKKGSFGMAKRTRQCGQGPTFCPKTPSKTMTSEMESKVCMGENCPSGYTKTQNGYCLLVSPSTMQRDEADEYCSDKGGYVININSKEKDDDFISFRVQNGRSGNSVYIDGRRASSTLPWTYKYEEDVVGFSNWTPNEPSGTLFVVAYTDNKWYDVSDGSRYVVCEYV